MGAVFRPRTRRRPRPRERFSSLHHDLLGTRFLDAASYSRTSRIEDEDDDEYEDDYLLSSYPIKGLSMTAKECGVSR